MDRFIARENIRRFKEQLVNCSDELQREMLEKLIAAGVKKLKKAHYIHAARSKQRALEIEESQTSLRKNIAETERPVNTSDEMLAPHHRKREDDDNQVEAA